MKRIVGAIVLCLLLLSLACCGRQVTQPTTAPSQSTQPTTSSTGTITVTPEENVPSVPIVTRPEVTLPDITMPPERPPDIPPPQNPSTGPSLPDAEEI